MTAINIYVHSRKFTFYKQTKIAFICCSGRVFHILDILTLYVFRILTLIVTIVNFFVTAFDNFNEIK